LLYYNLDFNVLIDALPFIIKGLWVTVLISVVSSVLAFLIGLTTAFIRNLSSPLIKFITVCWIEVTRNTPLLIQLYILYKGLPSIGIKIPAILCGIVALSLYTGAYMSEVIRSGINSVANEQVQAARALGLTKLQTFIMIVLPQAIRIVIPPLSSQFINLIKNSSLVSFIAVTDIFYVIYKGAVDDFRVFEYFICGIVIYMFMTGMVALTANILEKCYKIRGRMVGV